MIQLNFPELRQTSDYDCGATVLQAVLAYYGREVSEEVVLKLAKTSKEEGTAISRILGTLEDFGLQFDKKVMTNSDLKMYLDKKIPVIILLQAWREEKIDYARDFADGHWAVVIGYDNERIIFEDPYTFERSFLTEKELSERWHGQEDGQVITNLGIAVYGPEPNYDSKKLIHMD